MPILLPPSDDEPLDLEDEREEKRTTLRTTDDLMETPQGKCSDDPAGPGKTG